MSVVNDDIPEDTELFRATLAIFPADQARLGNHVTVSPDVATVTIQDNDGKQYMFMAFMLHVLSNYTIDNTA